ncbi:sphingomyelin phosphodiesterase [Streptomyces sp. NPDC005438]|uniref:sphingomyelin phosphodiesterase n=1 Tax=Streptomyces sp. NPDC005438 TaxID=3156880 RepID=UPI0033BCC845
MAALAATALTASASPGQAAEEAPRAASPKVLTYNTFLFNKLIYPNLGQDHRAEEIPQADFFQGNDVVVLQEMYENGTSENLMESAKSQYPHQTPVVGRTKDGWDATGGSYATTLEDGGVTVLSKWPIKRKEQYVYKDGCGVDDLANKGFAYVELEVNGEPVHVVGTHVQSDDKLCSEGQAAEVRSKQFGELNAFLDAKDIPTDEQVLVAGDFNVDSRSDEYPKMLADAGLEGADDRTGHAYSFDTQENTIAHARGAENPPRDLDYVLHRKGHAKPEGWTNEVYQEQSAPWTAPDGKEYSNLSDHYPVTGSAG